MSKVNPTSTLADLGLDSLMGTEIQQTLERDFDLVFSSREIRLLTINKLQEIGGDGAAGAGANVADGEESLGNSHLSNDSGLSISNRFDVNQLVPSSCVVHLNDVSNKDIPFFIVHPIEGWLTLLAGHSLFFQNPNKN